MTQCHWASRDLYTKDATEIQVSLISVPIIYNDFFKQVSLFPNNIGFLGRYK